MKKELLFHLLKQKNDFLIPSLLHNFSPNVIKVHCTNISLPFKDLFYVSAVLPQNAFVTTSPFTDVWRLRDFPPCLAAYQVSNKQRVCCCWSRPWTASVL